MVSPTPIDLTMPSAFLAMPRGSRLYGSPVVGSSTSQTSTSVVSAKNGSMQAEVGSGIRHMSDSLIAFQPAIEEPSNIMPSANVSSSIMADVESDVLPLAARIGEAEIGVFHVAVLDHFHDILWRRHGMRTLSWCW